MRFCLACPTAYQLSSEEIDRIMSQVPDMEFLTTSDPREAVRQADVLYTDTWISMGQEAEKAKRINDFAGFCIDEKLLALAPPHAVVLHCLPAYRGNGNQRSGPGRPALPGLCPGGKPAAFSKGIAGRPAGRGVKYDTLYGTLLGVLFSRRRLRVRFCGAP